MEKFGLAQRQHLTLHQKIELSKRRIREWYKHFNGDVYVAFSGGKDSTVLLNLVRELYPNVPGVFFDTGLEFPEIRKFVKTFDDIEIIRPKMNFKKVIETHGYPVISKQIAMYIRQVRELKPDSKTYRLRMHGIRSDGVKVNIGKIPEKWKYLIDAPFKISGRCCDVMKKQPAKAFEKETGLKPFIGMMAADSNNRMIQYLRHGCNSYNNKIQSNPLGFWLEKDIWNCIKGNYISYSDIYNMGYDRTGCMFCMFGIHLEKGQNRFQLMKRTHPKQYKYCINNLGCGKVLKFLNINYGNTDLDDWVQ